MSLEAFVQKQILGSYVGGEHLLHGEESPLVSPLTGRPWRSVSAITQDQVQRAITSSEEAYHSWKKVPAPERATYLRKMGDLILEHKALFANTMAHEMGKTVREGEGEAHYAAGYFHWFAGEAERIYGQTIPSQYPHKTLLVQKDPIGVCAAITPWNFPIGIPARKIAPALAAGCSILCKPSPECPLSMLMLAFLAEEAGLPPGLFNVLIGDEIIIGQALTTSPKVRKLSFTGICEVGRLLYRQSAETLKKLTLELGGHAPTLIFDDADLDKAVEGLLQGKLRNSGQTCVSPNRVYVQRSIQETFTERLIERLKALSIGDPLDPKTDLSEVLHPTSVEKIKIHLEDALSKGAEEIYSHPTVLTNITKEMLICQEETFGPVIPLIPFDRDEEGIALANDSPYGLAAYVFTESLQRARVVSQELHYGVIGLNDGVPSTPQAPFGGMRDSGFGRVGGPSGIEEYLVEKFISIG